MTYLASVILVAQSLLVLLILRKWIEAREDRNEKQRIIEGQDELLRKQRILIEEKMTEKVKEAFEKPKRPRGRPRKNA